MSSADPRIRISDSDRERAMSDLAGHYADGRLEHEEYDERLDAIWTARTRADLAVLFNDLPRPQPAAPAVRPAGRVAPASRRRRSGIPLFPALVVLIVLSALTEAPFWLLVFPLLFLRGRRGHTGHAGFTGHTGHTGPTDYRRPRRSPGW